ncbi:MAG: carboxypeptidase M32 [Rhodospirillales bacterium]|nr:carboxypeptidase M32 [Rhodospirillales bacterium]
MKNQTYQKLETLFKRRHLINESQGMLHWDMAAMMPPGGAESRGEQLAVLATLSHGILTGPEVGDLLGEADDLGNLSEWQSANLREMRRQWVHATAVSSELVEAHSKACSTSETLWRSARAEGDFKAVLPALEKVLSLTIEIAEAKAEALDCSPYDALLSQYEPDYSSKEIDILFSKLEEFLPDFIEEVIAKQAAEPAVLALKGPFDIEKQKALGMTFMKALGFDFDHGRLDVSLHPFCGGTAQDVRITTRYDESDFTSALMGVLHETGHAMYERGLPKEWQHQPVGQALGMSVHESQSLLIEMQACRSLEFLQYAVPLMNKTFKGSGPAWDLDNFQRLYTRVERSFIRVDADEATYPAHVIMRYNLEHALVSGDLKAADLPTAWNESLKKILNITPPSDREGVLQDIHWFDGAIGYFPTYTLGAMTAAQLFDSALTQDKTILSGIAKGDFSSLMGWLTDAVHSHGSCLSAHDILTKATGRPLDVEVFKKHLQTRYLD